MVWTTITTPENPPNNLDRFRRLQEGRGGLLNSLKEIGDSSISAGEDEELISGTRPHNMLQRQCSAHPQCSFLSLGKFVRP